MAYTGVMLARADMCEIVAMKLLNRFSSSKIPLTSVLMTGWDPLAGAPENVFEEVKMLLGGDSSEMNSPQCALEVSFFFFASLASPGSPTSGIDPQSRLADGDRDKG